MSNRSSGRCAYCLFRSLFYAVTVSDSAESKGTMTEKLEITWNQVPEHYSHYHPGNFLEGLRKSTENLGQGISCLGRNSNPVPAGTGYLHTNLTDTLILYKRNLLSEKNHKYQS